MVYDPLVRHKWAIMNADGAPMFAGTSFFVLVANPDDGAFQHIPPVSHIMPGDRSPLDYPLLNGNLDALFFITQNYGHGRAEPAQRPPHPVMV